MFSFEEISMLVAIIPVALHMFGFALLYTMKCRTKFTKIQRLYLLILSFSEFWLCALSIAKRAVAYTTNEKATREQIKHYITVFQNGGFAMLFYLVMIILTVDRGLLVRFNIRYDY